MAQYELHQFQDPAFPVIFHFDKITKEHSWSGGHWHEGVELLLGVEGETQVLQDGAPCAFGKDEIAVISSDKLHVFSGLSPRCLYYCLILSREFLENHGLPVAGVEFAPVVRDAQALKAFSEIIREMTAQAPYYKSAVLGLTLQLYALLLRGHQADARTSSPRQPQTVMALISYLREHLADDDAIGDACRAVGISRYTVCRLFKSYVNMSPVNFLNTLRCNEARGLLLMGKCNVSEAARRCGIENLSYFSRLYKRHVGILPSQEG